MFKVKLDRGELPFLRHRLSLARNARIVPFELDFAAAARNFLISSHRCLSRNHLIVIDCWLIRFAWKLFHLFPRWQYIFNYKTCKMINAFIYRLWMNVNLLLAVLLTFRIVWKGQRKFNIYYASIIFTVFISDAKLLNNKSALRFKKIMWTLYKQLWSIELKLVRSEII